MGDRTLGKSLKEARKKAKLTQQQVADKAGIHVNYYARLERDEVKTALDTLRNVSKILRVKVSDLIPF